MIWTRAFWQGAGERALKTLVATTLAQLGAGVIAAVSGGTAPTASLTDYNWPHIASVDALAVLVSLGIALGNASFTAGAGAQQAAAAVVARNQAAPLVSAPVFTSEQLDPPVGQRSDAPALTPSTPPPTA
jgi:hypothetical protein